MALMLFLSICLVELCLSFLMNSSSPKFLYFSLTVVRFFSFEHMYIFLSKS